MFEPVVTTVVLLFFSVLAFFTFFCAGQHGSVTDP
ncbi:hypothetical protein ALQ46_00954 [Pseudomonas savastanoi pv. phaseolicola]|nr:hypothetical protein ALQ46_00954 [Pseudomonas savastanoi pv. phaseolicola]